MKIGYARVSTLDQHLDLQLRALRKPGALKSGERKSRVSVASVPSCNGCSISSALEIR